MWYKFTMKPIIYLSSIDFSSIFFFFLFIFYFFFFMQASPYVSPAFFFFSSTILLFVSLHISFISSSTLSSFNLAHYNHHHYECWCFLTRNPLFLFSFFCSCHFLQSLFFPSIFSLLRIRFGGRDGKVGRILDYAQSHSIKDNISKCSILVTNMKILSSNLYL